MDKLKELPIEAITPSPHNPRLIQLDSPAIAELAESIKAHGLLQPVMCRPRGDGYELLAGRRRYEACLLNNATTILAIVLDDLDDQAAIEVTVLENLQREDLTPLEEARGVKELLASGREPADVAARLGKSEVWVRRRAKLLDLTPAWIEALAGPLPNDPDRNKTIAEFRDRVSVSVLEIAAHLPAKTQDAVLKAVLCDAYKVGLVAGSAARFREVVSGHCRDLESAPWEWTDAGIGPVPCAICPNRSDKEPDLFRDIGNVYETDKDGNRIEKAYCLNERCFRAKYEAWVKQARTEAERKTKQIIVTIGDGYNRNAPKGEFASWQIKDAKKGDKGAVPVLHLDGKQAGKVTFAILPKATAGKAATEDAAEPDSVAVKRIKHMQESLQAWIEAQETCPDALRDMGRMLVSVAVWGFYDTIAKTPDAFDQAAAGKSKAWWTHLWKGVRSGMYDDLYFQSGEGTDNEERLDLVLHACGLDKQDFLDAATKAIPDETPAPAKSGKSKRSKNQDR